MANLQNRMYTEGTSREAGACTTLPGPFGHTGLVDHPRSLVLDSDGPTPTRGPAVVTTRPIIYQPVRCKHGDQNHQWHRWTTYPTVAAEAANILRFGFAPNTPFASKIDGLPQKGVGAGRLAPHGGRLIRALGSTLVWILALAIGLFGFVVSCRASEYESLRNRVITARNMVPE